MGKVEHRPTQNERIIEYMKKHGSITQFEALQSCGIMRLASRISDLRRLGYPITSKMVTVKNRFDEECRVKRYSLVNSCNDVECLYYEPTEECPARDGCGGYERRVDA